MKWIISNLHASITIRDYLREIHEFSRRTLIAVKQEGGILVNGQPQTVRYILKVGDLLEICFPKESTGPFLKPEEMNLSIVYEDDAVLVVDKPAGMATIPSVHHPSGTVANGILSYYLKNKLPFTVHVVTRLDRDTSGLLLIAKHRYSHSILSNAQQTGKVERGYKAIVEGNMSVEKGVIDAPIDRKDGSIIERMVKKTGKRAVTHFHTEKILSTTHSLLNVQLETGRTHQIRVHFSYKNHPLAGDDLYGGNTDLIDRHALHCFQLSFEHPFTKERILLESSLPEDMNRLLNQMN
ncbi:RluA family pseudouridine synthase [Oceanobacillus halophilus]|uniref:Pseudouridine synthase n=1 Tax=Oceanobacillus halophilus TaxID=930130 RepID=A0A495A0K8_9BACI|nr:RluA family pseudouridine synthase [Oceanobacillus halophilus]RKQ32637.1 RluA family pseudouridine synthase [Oceanobacillus halophilus]